MKIKSYYWNFCQIYSNDIVFLLFIEAMCVCMEAWLMGSVLMWEPCHASLRGMDLMTAIQAFNPELTESLIVEIRHSNLYKPPSFMVRARDCSFGFFFQFLVPRTLNPRTCWNNYKIESHFNHNQKPLPYFPENWLCSSPYNYQCGFLYKLDKRLTSINHWYESAVVQTHDLPILSWGRHSTTEPPGQLYKKLQEKNTSYKYCLYIIFYFDAFFSTCN